MLAHECFVGRGRGDPAVLGLFDPVRNSQAAVHVDPFVFGAISPRWICSKFAMSSTSPKFGKPSWVRMRSALMSSAASPSRPSSTIMVPYQMALVSPTPIGSNTWI